MNFGPYQIRGILGEGGMGVVYLAQDPTGRDCALKVIKKELGAAPDVRLRFLREIRLAKRLSHPHLVVTHDAGEVDGTLFLASELVLGGSLARVLTSRGALTEAEALWIARDLLSALDAVATAGMVHRDVKPDNILLGLDGVAKLSDLGLARSSAADRTRYTADGQILGTPEYLAPEQFDGGEALDPRCDLYAAGCVLFECLAGRVPFVDARFLELLSQKLKQPAPDVRTFAPGTRAEVAELVRRLLEKDRTRRPASGAQALAEVERLLVGLPARAPLITPQRLGFTLPGPPRDSLWGPAVTRPPLAAGTTLRSTQMSIVEVSPAAPDAAQRVRSSAETIVLIPPAGSRPDAEVGLARAKLVTGEPGHERTLFLYAGTRLQIGREGIDRGEVDLCLRLRPSAGNEAGTRAISGKHLRIAVQQQRASVTDTASTSGTVLDGRRLSPDTSEPLPDRCELHVAGAIRLLVRVTTPLPAAGPGTATPVSGDCEDASSNPGEPSVVLERITNGTEHRYALIPERIRLSLDADQALVADAAGEVEVAVRKKGLELRAPGGRFEPLIAGMALWIGGKPVRVGELRPEDQK